MPVKPGWKTTEFWGKVLVQALTLFGAIHGMLDPKTAIVVGGILEGIYNIMRPLQKCPDITTISTTVVNPSTAKPS